MKNPNLTSKTRVDIFLNGDVNPTFVNSQVPSAPFSVPGMFAYWTTDGVLSMIPLGKIARLRFENVEEVDSEAKRFDGGM
jgi:hypothetical protein